MRAVGVLTAPLFTPRRPAATPLTGAWEGRVAFFGRAPPRPSGQRQRASKEAVGAAYSIVVALFQHRWADGVLALGPAGGYTDPDHWRESVSQRAVTRAVADRVFSEEIGSLLVPHALRRTAAHNMLLHQGVDLTQVMAILGHASFNITVALRGHVKPITD
jgi:hypothetical protein